ncbi:39S ribosomal protein L35, mitochondrial [Trichonephila inaurata madagascariensis]|uniref:Large ribosomal subunit protein bL35m n=1 Tax=Trichonephila inaurata madagascariensis TaxID=2747483 RepID=A0A8X6XEH2_9ARAC|nr:39S ribosomal protein L35, mitochondrial [Trichonephila inaurata madagascariensis]GFY51000.1 39S ribosomal protein L35, mitochondrial [Trichonephila inaurata madagascariensis]
MLKALGSFSSKFVKHLSLPTSNVMLQASGFSTWKNLTSVAFKQYGNGRFLSVAQPTSVKPLLAVDNQNVNQTRTVTKFSLKTGKKKSVATVLRRFFRLHNGIWIRRRAGCHKRMHKRTPDEKYNLRQHVVCTQSQCLMLDKMITDHWKKRKYYIDDPFEPYHDRNNLDYVYPYRKR